MLVKKEPFGYEASKLIGPWMGDALLASYIGHILSGGHILASNLDMKLILAILEAKIWPPDKNGKLRRPKIPIPFIVHKLGCFITKKLLFYHQFNAQGSVFAV